MAEPRAEEDRDELISRFLDGELDEASLRELERDPRAGAALRRALRVQQELRALADSGAGPGPRLTARIMRGLPEAPDGGPQPRTASWLRRPLAIPLYGVALAALLVLALGAALLLRAAAPAAPPAASASAPACSRALLVRFVLRAPHARQVSLAGDFNDWSVQATPLADPDGDGIWTVTLPLKPGRYEYKFVVDGERWVVDPEAPAYHPDGFGGQNALLSI